MAVILVSSFGSGLELALPVFVLGLGVWISILVRGVPTSRWRRPGHWAKAIVLTAAVVVGLVPTCLVVWLLMNLLLGR